MIVICEECGKKYQIKEAQIRGKEATFTFPCKVCQQPVMVGKPATPTTPPEPMANLREPAEKTSADIAEAPPPHPGPANGADKKTTVIAPPRQRKNRFGLTEKTVSLMLVISLLPLFVYWGLSFKQTSGQLKKTSGMLLLQTSSGLADRVDQWIDENTRLIQVFARLPGIVSMQATRQEDVLASIGQSYPWISGLTVVDRQESIVAGKAGKAMAAFLASGGVKPVLDSGQTVWHTDGNDSVSEPFVVVSTPVRDDQGIVGALVFSMSIEPVRLHIEGWKQGDAGFAFLTDASGNAIVTPRSTGDRPAAALVKHPLVAAHRSGEKGLIAFKDETGRPMVGRAIGTVNGWIVAIQAEEKELFRPLKETQLFSYIYLMATMILVAIIAVLAGRAMTRPIKRLKDAADRISIGDLDVSIDEKRKDEIGDLAEAISRMQDSLRGSIERLRRRGQGGRSL